MRHPSLSLFSPSFYNGILGFREIYSTLFPPYLWKIESSLFCLLYRVPTPYKTINSGTPEGSPRATPHPVTSSIPITQMKLAYASIHPHNGQT